MKLINMVFEFEDDGELSQAAETIEERLRSLEVVEQAQASPEEPDRFGGMEIVAAIGVAVLLVRGSRELTEEARKLVAEVKKLMVEVHDLKEVYVNLGNQRIPIEELTEDQYEQLVLES